MFISRMFYYGKDSTMPCITTFIYISKSKRKSLLDINLYDWTQFSCFHFLAFQMRLIFLGRFKLFVIVSDQICVNRFFILRLRFSRKKLNRFSIFKLDKMIDSTKDPIWLILYIYRPRRLFVISRKVLKL